jgi:hypothetical protein
MFYWNRNAVPLADVGVAWRKTCGIRDADWHGMIKKAKKAGQIVQSGDWLEIVDSQWLRSPTSRADPTKAERMKRMREKKTAAKKAAAEKAAAEAAEAGRGAPRGEGGAPRGAPQAPHIEGSGSKEQLELLPQKTAVERRKEEEAQDQAAPSSLKGPGSDTAGPGTAPDTAAGATIPPAGGPPPGLDPRRDFLADPSWEKLLLLSLLSLAFGRRATTAQKQRLQEAIAEARGRGATLGMIYRRMRRPRPGGTDAFDCVRMAGLDAKACLAKFREIAKVDTLTWPEIERLAFDTTTRQGMQQQGLWDQTRADFGLVLADVATLTPADVGQIGGGRL